MSILFHLIANKRIANEQKPSTSFLTKLKKDFSERADVKQITSVSG